MTEPAALKLGVPSKGRLRDATVAWFAARGIGIENAASSREYAGHVTGIDGVDLVLLSAGEIPRELAAGRIHLGVTGEDLVHEKIPAWQDRLRPVARMGFGHADLIIAVPTSWVDVETVADLDEACAAFRAVHGQPLRIATKYHALARGFLKRAGVADYRLVDSQGATEGVVRNQAAEAIIDITSSGETLAANHLKVLSDGLILASQATLWLALDAPLGPRAARDLDRLTQRLRDGAA
jgi:ATP phosphoribosyltransferase